MAGNPMNEIVRQNGLLLTPESVESDGESWEEEEEEDAEYKYEQDLEAAENLRRSLHNISLSTSGNGEGLGFERLDCSTAGRESPEFRNFHLFAGDALSPINVVPMVSSSTDPPAGRIYPAASVEASNSIRGSRGGRSRGRGRGSWRGRGRDRDRSSTRERPYNLPSDSEIPSTSQYLPQPDPEIEMRWSDPRFVMSAVQNGMFVPWRPIGGIGLAGFLENFQDNLAPRLTDPRVRPAQRSRLFQTDRYRHPDIPYVFPPSSASASICATSSAQSGISSNPQPSSSSGPHATAGSSMVAGTGTGGSVGNTN